MLGSAYIISKLFINIRHEQPLEVKGYAEKEVLSDMGAFSFSVELKTSEFQTDYKKFSSIVEEIVRSLGDNAPGDLQIDKQSIKWKQVFKNDENGKKNNEIDYYILSQEVKINSRNVNWIDAKSRSLMDFLSKSYQSATLAIVRDGTLYSAKTAEYINTYVKKKGIKTTGEEVYNKGMVNFKPLIKKIKTIAPDIIYIIAYTSDASLFMINAHQININPKIQTV